MRRLLCLVSGALALCACSAERQSTGPSFTTRDSAGVQIIENYRPTPGEAGGWRIGQEPLFIIRASDGGQENRLLDPTSIDVDSRGRIIVGDGNQVGWNAVLVYDSNGRFLFQAGRAGQGPGEFGQLWWASAYRGDSLVAFDMSGDKISVFDPEGNFVRLVRMPSLQAPQPERGTYGYTAGVDAAFGDGSFLAYPFGHLNIEGGPGPAWYEHLLLRLSADGQSWDTLGTFDISQQYWSGTRQEQYWYAPVSVTAVKGDELYFARGDEFEIRRYGPDGELNRVVRRTFTPHPVSEKDRAELKSWYLSRVASSPEANDQILSRIRKNLESARFAESIPPLSGILLDTHENMWVEQFRWFTPTDRPPSIAPAHWSVFDSSGVWRGDVETPPGFILRVVGPDRVLGFMIDSMDVKEIYAFPLERSGR